MAGSFGSDLNGAANPTRGRDDISVGLVWGLDNLGLGNRALVRERRAEQHQMLVELFRIQDLVAGDVVRAHAQLTSAAARMSKAEMGLIQAQKAYAGDIDGLGKIIGVGDAKLVLNHTLDVIDSLRALAREYDNYFGSVSDYNTAQFRLFRVLGYAAELVSAAAPGSCR
jgi:outer membrane protein TolC